MSQPFASMQRLAATCRRATVRGRRLCSLPQVGGGSAWGTGDVRVAAAAARCTCRGGTLHVPDSWPYLPWAALPS